MGIKTTKPKHKMTDKTKPRSSTRQRGVILSGEPLGLVWGSACEPERHANVDSPNRENKNKCDKLENSNLPKATKPTEIGVTQINLHKSKAATSLLSQNIQANSGTTHIVLITEPHSIKGKIPNIEGRHYHKIYPMQTESPRACIIIKDTLQYMEITELQSRDTIAILVETPTTTGKRATIFASIYQPPQYENQPPTREMRKIVEYAIANSLPLIIGCDTNGHHQMWGSKNNNKRGNNLAEYILTANLHTANVGSEPTFKSANGESIIDVTFTTANIANKIKNWHVAIDEESLSDHKYIKFTVSTETEKTETHLNPRKTNWTTFREMIKNTKPETQPFPTSTEELEAEIQTLTSRLQTAFAYATKTNTKGKAKQKKTKWWTSELTRMKRNTNRALRNFNNHKCQETWQIWKEEKRTIQATIQREKRSAWKKYTSNIERLHEAQRLTKMLDKGPTQQINLIKKGDGSNTKTTEEVLKQLIDTHFPGNEETTITNTTHPETRKHIKPTEWIKAGQIVTQTKIRWAIKEFQPYKSPGVDSIYPIMLQQAIDIIEDNIHNILRACIAYGYIPEAWRTSKAIFIPKPGKENYNEAKSFRPISLTSFMLKTLEKILDRELRDTTLKVNPINPNQHAYHIGKSTETALHALTTKIEKAIGNKEYALCTFFDIAGAFDNAPAKTITKALQTRNTEPLIGKWIVNLLKTRIVTTSKGNTSTTVKATRGCPQGGVISPLLWCLVVDELLSKLNGRNIDTQAYSDDGAIIITGKNLQQICKKAQEGINMAVEWSKKNDLTIHPNKTNMVLFTNKRKLNGWKAPKIGNTPIPLQNSFKYLGVTLDSKLNFKEHIKQKCTSTTRTFFQVRQTLAGNWGLSPKIIKWLYITVIRPRITYASVIWWARSTLTHEKTLLQKTQRIATISITGAMKTTPNIALESITGLTPLHIHIQSEAMKAYIRMKANNSWTTGPQQGHRIIESITKQTIPRKVLYTDLIRKTFWFDKKYQISNTDTNEDEPAEAIICQTHSEERNNTEIWSSATCETQELHSKYKLENKGTKAQGELLALRNMCTEINIQNGSKVRIICENHETLKHLEAVCIKSQLLLECIYELNKLAKNNHVTIELRNEKTPKTLKQNNTPTTNANIGTSYKEVSKHIDAWGKQDHTEEFTSYPGCKYTKDNIGNPYSTKLDNICRRNRKDLRIITHILTGHSWLNKHMHTLKISNTPTCPQCQIEDETTEHYIYKCTEYNEIRKEIFGSTFTPRMKPIRDIDHNKLIAYCKKTKRFNDIWKSQE